MTCNHQWTTSDPMTADPVPSHIVPTQHFPTLPTRWSRRQRPHQAAERPVVNIGSPLHIKLTHYSHTTPPQHTAPARCLAGNALIKAAERLAANTESPSHIMPTPHSHTTSPTAHRTCLLPCRQSSYQFAKQLNDLLSRYNVDCSTSSYLSTPLPHSPPNNTPHLPAALQATPSSSN